MTVLVGDLQFLSSWSSSTNAGGPGGVSFPKVDGHGKPRRRRVSGLVVPTDPHGSRKSGVRSGGSCYDRGGVDSRAHRSYRTLRIRGPVRRRVGHHRGSVVKDGPWISNGHSPRPPLTPVHPSHGPGSDRESTVTERGRHKIRLLLRDPLGTSPGVVVLCPDFRWTPGPVVRTTPTPSPKPVSRRPGVGTSTEPPNSLPPSVGSQGALLSTGARPTC